MCWLGWFAGHTQAETADFKAANGRLSSEAIGTGARVYSRKWNMGVDYLPTMPKGAGLASPVDQKGTAYVTVGDWLDWDNKAVPRTIKTPFLPLVLQPNQSGYIIFEDDAGTLYCLPNASCKETLEK
jgi:hypothetical protein